MDSRRRERRSGKLGEKCALSRLFKSTSPPIPPVAGAQPWVPRGDARLPAVALLHVRRVLLRLHAQALTPAGTSTGAPSRGTHYTHTYSRSKVP